MDIGMSELTQEQPALQPEARPGGQPFATIDDALEKARVLVAELKQLAEYRHPLGVRRGRKGVKTMVERDERSKTLKAGSRTYFFDVKETQEGKPYLVITESRFKGDGEERERNTVVVFPESAEEFAAAVAEMVENLR